MKPTKATPRQINKMISDVTEFEQLSEIDAVEFLLVLGYSTWSRLNAQRYVELEKRETRLQEFNDEVNKSQIGAS